jgi:hypothetical protein
MYQGNISVCPITYPIIIKKPHKENKICQRFFSLFVHIVKVVIRTMLKNIAPLLRTNIMLLDGMDGSEENII